MPALALVAGSIIGALARWRGHPMRVVGPALLALAYLIAGPGTSGEKYQTAP